MSLHIPTSNLKYALGGSAKQQSLSAVTGTYVGVKGW